MIHFNSMKETKALKMQLAQKNAENQKLKAHIVTMNKSVNKKLEQRVTEQKLIKENEIVKPEYNNMIELSVNGNKLKNVKSEPETNIVFKVNGK